MQSSHYNRETEPLKGGSTGPHDLEPVTLLPVDPAAPLPPPAGESPPREFF